MWNSIVNRQSRYSLSVLVPWLLTIVLLPGCMHSQFVNEPYPRWGKEYSIPGSESDPTLLPTQSLILRVLSPPAEVEPPACLLLVHGMNEYIGHYADIARYLSRQYVVAGFDHYAHGLSNPVLQEADQALQAGAGKQDVSTAFLAQEMLGDLEPMRRDLDRALNKTVEVCDQQGKMEKPVFIVAHSLGALITASYLLRSHNNGNSPAKRVSGVVFLGPGFAVSKVPGWRGWLANPLIGLSFHAETHFLNPHDEPLPMMLFNQVLALVTVPVLDGLFEVFSWPGIRRIATPTTPDWVVNYLTDSVSERVRLQADGWIVRRSLLRYVKGIENEIVQFRRHMDEFSLPYYLIYSAHDPITAAWGSQDFIEATQHNHRDKQYQQLQQSRYHHHLFLTQPLRDTFLTDIEQWLDKRIQKSTHENKPES